MVRATFVLLVLASSAFAQTRPSDVPRDEWEKYTPAEKKRSVEVRAWLDNMYESGLRNSRIEQQQAAQRQQRIMAAARNQAIAEARVDQSRMEYEAYLRSVYPQPVMVVPYNPYYQYGAVPWPY